MSLAHLYFASLDISYANKNDIGVLSDYIAYLLGKVLACLFDSTLDPQQQCRLPFVQLAELVVLE